MDILLISVFFLLLAPILLVVLVFLYKLTMAVSRLDHRLEQLAAHLRDLNLYDLHPGGEEVLGAATEIEGPVELGTDVELDAARTTGTSRRGRRSKRGGRPTETDTTPLHPPGTAPGA